MTHSVVVNKADRVTIVETKEDLTFRSGGEVHDLLMAAGRGLVNGTVSIAEAAAIARIGEAAVCALDVQLRIARQSRAAKREIVDGEIVEGD